MCYVQMIHGNVKLTFPATIKMENSDALEFMGRLQTSTNVFTINFILQAFVSWASEAGATNSLPHVYNMGISHSRYHDDGTINSISSSFSRQLFT